MEERTARRLSHRAVLFDMRAARPDHAAREALDKGSSVVSVRLPVSRLNRVRAVYPHPVKDLTMDRLRAQPGRRRIGSIFIFW